MTTTAAPECSATRACSRRALLNYPPSTPARHRRVLRRAGRRLPARLGTEAAQPRPARPHPVIPAPSSCSPSCSACPWTTRYSWSPASARNGPQPKTTSRAVRTGQATTGRVIIAAASIMILVFGAFVPRRQQVVGGDRPRHGRRGPARRLASCARLLVPALMHLSGRANWWLPGWLDRVLPSPSNQPPRQPRADGSATGSLQGSTPMTSAAMRQASGLRHVFARRRTTQPRGCPCDRARVKPAAAAPAPPMPLGGLRSCGTWGVGQTARQSGRLGVAVLDPYRRCQIPRWPDAPAAGEHIEFRSITDQTLPVDGLVV